MLVRIICHKKDYVKLFLENLNFLKNVYLKTACLVTKIYRMRSKVVILLATSSNGFGGASNRSPTASAKLVKAVPAEREPISFE